MTDIDQETNKLKDLISSSERILITSHISPDPDAVSSLLLMGTALKQNFPGKQIRMVLEEEPLGLDFLSGYQDIVFKPLFEEAASFKPDLLVLLDGNNYSRASRMDGDKIRDFILNNGTKTAIIDHHEPADKDEVDVFINRFDPATAQTVYEVLFNEMNLGQPDGVAQTAMVGFYADTGGFVYLKSGSQGKMFDFAEELVAKGANVEQTKGWLSRYTESEMHVLSELAANISHQDNYSYSFIRDEFINNWLKAGKTAADLQGATGLFVNEFIRNIDERQWGFIVFRNTLQGDNTYSASFRSVGGVKDVAAIALKLSGGGHKPAAGAKFEANSVQEAIKKVQSAILEP